MLWPMVLASQLLAAVDGVNSTPPALVLPFGLLLLLIAVMPLAAKHWWERNYAYVSVGLGAFVGLCYLTHAGGAAAVGHTLREYFSFISLLAALYVVAGGIHIRVRGRATPAGNVVFLALGAALANIIGTTGASLVLIRPWLHLNKDRLSPYPVVFFIFLVSNIGGALTPIGDPPLFLGYLSGVPFFWLLPRVLAPWLATLGVLLGVFYVWDARHFRNLPRKLEQAATPDVHGWRLEGWANGIFLLGVVGAVFLPEGLFPLREGVMLALAAASFALTKREVREKNAFNFGPIQEVAWLFCGIFLTMMPALDYLAAQGPSLGFTHPLQYYFASGGLSSVLDNAPTYLNFLQLAQATAAVHDPALTLPALLGHPEYAQYIVSLSLGAVFFGAMTYIGNGPNFMVKAIAEEAGVPCPTFHRYLTHYSLPVLLPVLLMVGWLFL